MRINDIIKKMYSRELKSESNLPFTSTSIKWALVLSCLPPSLLKSINEYNSQTKIHINLILTHLRRSTLGAYRQHYRIHAYHYYQCAHLFQY